MKRIIAALAAFLVLNATAGYQLADGSVETQAKFVNSVPCPADGGLGSVYCPAVTAKNYQGYVPVYVMRFNAPTCAPTFVDDASNIIWVAVANIPIKDAADVTTCAKPALCSYTFSDWSACDALGTQVRAVTSAQPAGCIVAEAQTQRACTYTPPPTCSVAYGLYGPCVNGKQVRSYASVLPAGCTFKDPATNLTLACTSTATSYFGTCTAYTLSDFGMCDRGVRSRIVTDIQPPNTMCTPPAGVSLTEPCVVTDKYADCLAYPYDTTLECTGLPGVPSGQCRVVRTQRDCSVFKGAAQ